MTNFNNVLSFVALIIAIIVGTMYITRELSKSKDVERKLDEIERLRVLYKEQADSIAQITRKRDAILIAQIDSAYSVLDRINQKRNATVAEIHALDVTISSLKAQREEFYKSIGGTNEK